MGRGATFEEQGCVLAERVAEMLCLQDSRTEFPVAVREIRICRDSISDLFSRKAHQVGELSCKQQPLYSRVGDRIGPRGHFRCTESGRTTGCRRIHVNVPSRIYSHTPLTLHSTAQSVPKLEVVPHDIGRGGRERLSQE